MDEKENKNKQLENQVLTPQQSFQPPAIVNGQTFIPSATMVEQIGDDTAKKPSKWKYFFITLGILQILGIALFFLGMFSAAKQAEQGVSGTEFIALALYITVVPSVAILAIINIISLPIYLFKSRVRGKFLIFSIISLLISFVLFSFGTFMVYRLYSYPKQLSEELDRKYENIETEQSKARSTEVPEKTKDEAFTLLNECRVDYFIGYTDINLIKEDNTKAWLNAAEKSSTGIEISIGNPTHIFVSKQKTIEYQEEVKKIRDACYDKKKLYIVEDNWIETEYPIGQWTKVEI